MIEIQNIRQDAETIVSRLERRGVKEAQNAIQEILEIDNTVRKFQTELQQMQADMNQSARTIGALMQEGKKDEAEAAKAKTSSIKDEIKALEEKFNEETEKLNKAILELPNPAHPSVPVGNSEQDNEIVFMNDLAKDLPKGQKPHWEITEEKNLIDFELGVKLTGAGFPVYRGKGARLQRALIQFFLDQAIEAGYEEIQPPLVVNEDSGYATGQLPDKEGQMYFINEDNLYLIPTAEVPITNIYRDVIVKEEQFPIKNCGYTPCFRREAGSYGKDVRGLNRLHQFDKVEIVQVVKPEGSYEILDQMVGHVKGLLEALNLPYRVAALCGGDLGFAAAKTFDMEVYSSGQDKWLEVSSVSNFETFQSNRLKLRFKDENKKTTLAHTLNGSALALPRIYAALLENNYRDGEVHLPEVLHSYTGFKTI